MVNINTIKVMIAQRRLQEMRIRNEMPGSW